MARQVRPLDIRDGHARIMIVGVPNPDTRSPHRTIATFTAYNSDDYAYLLDLVYAAMPQLVAAIYAQGIQVGQQQGRFQAAQEARQEAESGTNGPDVIPSGVLTVARPNGRTARPNGARDGEAAEMSAWNHQEDTP